MASLRARLRAALIAMALLAHGAAALPIPGSVRRSQFDTPMAKDEMARWAALLGSVGIATTPGAVSDFFYTVGKQFVGARKVMLAPFKGFYRITGTGQGWGLFTYPDSFPHKLCIDIRSARQPWQEIYAGLDPEHDWRRAQLVYRRVRGVYDGNADKPGAAYENFAGWVSGLAFADFPEAEAVRVSFIRTHSVGPYEPQDPEQKRRWERIRTRPKP